MRCASPVPARRLITTPGPIRRENCRTTSGICARRKHAEPFFAPEGDTWNVSRVCGTFKEREGWHGCQMPIGVLDRIIRSSSNKGDIVLDPFNGSGTTVVSAALLGRKYVGIDQSEEYVGYARKRLAHALEKSPAATNGNGHVDLFHGAVDPDRESKVMTVTDAFGRKRVPRGKRRTIKTA